MGSPRLDSERTSTRGVQLTTGRGPTLIAEQLDRIADGIDQLYNLSSNQGKVEATIEDAEAMVIQTYMLIGEVARLTGLHPVTEIPSGNGIGAAENATV